LNNLPYILYVGRLNKIKGVDLLLKAFRKIKANHTNLQLLIAGPDDGMLRELTEFVMENELEESVSFLGFVTQAQKINLIKSALFLVVPSIQDAMPLVILEAGILGIPVLITNRVGFPDLQFIDGGVEVDASVSGLEYGLDKLLEDPEELRRKGVSLKEHIKKNYLWSSIALEHLKVFCRINN
jgi:glycosyltransferase involved in cell wall biosynthesis